MPYSDLIQQEGEYTYSANIQFDIESDRKLQRFIPNETTVALLREYFVDITRSTPAHHSRILYGSYGTGKSHFLTVLSLLLSKTYTTGAAYQKFLDRINDYDVNLAGDIDAFIMSNTRKPFLVVPIVFDFEDYDRCIYFSLKKKLEGVGIQISFKTFYDQANSLLEQWGSNADSADKLMEACKKAKTTPEDLSLRLSSCDKKAETVFQNVFAEMTFGVKYIYEVSSLTDTINQANEVISEKYSGIVFIFDEFGRYIEDNIKRIKVKSVQDMAEFCDHCSYNNHIILVSHKEISQYTQRYGKSIANEWKKVEGRYKSTPINDKPDQCLSLMRNILVKNDAEWREFSGTFKRQLSEMYADAADFRGFLIDFSRNDNPFEDGFPLHPIALFALDKLSKKVAQNERTFFTYLASKDDNSLYRFLISTDQADFHFVGIDAIYDYFEPNIRAVQSDSSYEWYKNLQTALAKNHSSAHDDTPEVRILKVIAAIGVINDASALNANKATLLSVIDCPKGILSNALVGLSERKIIKYSGSYDRYDFFEASIFDVEAMIAEESKLVSEEAIVNTLNEEFIDFVLYPHQYNREYRISRVFIPMFALSASDFSKKSFVSRLGQFYDGVLIMLLADHQTDLDTILAQSTNVDRSIVFVNTDAQPLMSAVKKYVAVKYLESQKATYSSKDPTFEKELLYFKQEISASVFALINEWKINLDNSAYIVSGGEIHNNIQSFAMLSSLASDICVRDFGRTLIVNNELINKNTVSGSIATAKRNAITSILQGKIATTYFDLPMLSPDYIAVRSVLAKNGFIPFEEPLEQNTLNNGEMPQIAVAEELNAFITKAREECVCFNDLYTALKRPPYGLRDGYLSIILAYMLVPYKKSLIISSHNVEQEITADLFEEIIRRPNDYSFLIASWTSEQVDYLDSIELIFNEYVRTDSMSKNRLKALYEAMLAHYKGVSKFSRTTQAYVSSDTKAYRKLLEKPNTNYSIFLFEQLAELGDTLPATIRAIQKAKMELEDALLTLSVDVASSICALFDAPSSQSLSSLFVESYQTKWLSKRQKSFDYFTNAFLEFASKVKLEDSDYDIVLRLSKSMTGFELLYWNDSHKDEFIKKLSDVKEKLDSYKNKKGLLDRETKVTLATSGGNEKSIVFDRQDLNGLSQTVKNKMNATFDNYGLSITYDEKVQILLSLLDDLVEGK